VSLADPPTTPAPQPSIVAVKVQNVKEKLTA